ncbi:gamma-tubulin complex component 4 [Brachionus plicatilis]|uniref:Gamma-tubulin complex component n=1 Tax=Brachionus plicatilis TaxID=10195 RepID=A0A3M7PHQ5_BRAPC|nr:gamma-tubulin complex component 4 [Brachionus plicatilis]
MLKADVLETQFEELGNKIKSSKDFEQIRYAHDTFLTKIQAQSFILNNLVSSCLNDIMESCLNFCSILTGVEDKLINKEFPNEKIESIIKVIFLYFFFKLILIYSFLDSLILKNS